MIHRSVVGLHREQPIELPFHFGKKIGQRAGRLGNVELDPFDLRLKILPGAEHAADGDAGVDDVLVVVAGVVPAASRRAMPLVDRHVVADDEIEMAIVEVAGGVLEDAALVLAADGRAAAHKYMPRVTV